MGLIGFGSGSQPYLRLDAGTHLLERFCALPRFLPNSMKEHYTTRIWRRNMRPIILKSDQMKNSPLLPLFLGLVSKSLLRIILACS